MEKDKQNILVICGPTSSGKTNLALQLAKELGRTNILSVDSRQAYQELDIVTGKDIPKHLSPKIHLFGTDIFKPTEVANLANFTRYARKIIAESTLNKIPTILVGGTGLYLKAITENLSDITVPPDQKLRQKLEKLSLLELQEKLKQTNLEKYSSLNHSDVMNPRRLIRYIEISLSTKRNLHPEELETNVYFHWVGISVTKEDIYKYIRARVINRLENGAIEEVKRLLTKYQDHSLPIFSSLGVSQIKDYLDQKISKDKLINIWTNAETDYARRQMVWFKKQSNIVWYDKNSDRQKLIAELKKIYKTCSKNVA